MIQQTAPMTLLELVDRIKEKSNDTLLSTISANGGKAEIKSIAPLETAGHGDVAFLAIFLSSVAAFNIFLMNAFF